MQQKSVYFKLTLHLDINLKCFFKVPNLLKTKFHSQLTFSNFRKIYCVSVERVVQGTLNRKTFV
jgi:hypothetical protein